MTFLLSLLNSLAGSPQELLYYIQGIIYLLACSAIRCGRHASWRIYLASSLIHITLGLLHHWPHG